MISVEKALQILESNVAPTGQEIRLLSESTGYVLSATISSLINMPPFRQSAMDGYACHFKEGIDSYEVVGEIAAGSSQNPELGEGECVRIFTGGMVPDTANLVVQQEWIERVKSAVRITRPVEAGKNIRSVGEQIKAGELALPKGTCLNPAAIGFLAGLGIDSVEVFKKPVIDLITTGNELVLPGEVLEMGQIYESNSWMLESALQNQGFNIQHKETVSDDYAQTLNSIEHSLQNSDLLLLTGGISVGDYDFVGKALHELGVEELVYKINQKPGKPVYIGKYGSTFVAALPGNPAAALTCFYIYVLPLLHVLMGKAFSGLEEVKAPIAQDYEKKGDRAEFLKAELRQGEFHILDGQSSAMLRSFAAADALVYIPSTVQNIKRGEAITGFKLPK